MKIKLKKLDKKTEEIFKASSVAVLLENLTDNIKIVAEGQTDLGRKIDKLDSRMDNMEGKMDRMEIRMGNLEGRVGNLEIEMKEGFSSVMDYLKRIDEELVSIRRDVDTLKEKKADRDENIALEKRLEKIEKEMMNLKSILIKKKVIA